MSKIEAKAIGFDPETKIMFCGLMMTIGFFAVTMASAYYRNHVNKGGINIGHIELILPSLPKKEAVNTELLPQEPSIASKISRKVVEMTQTKKMTFEAPTKNEPYDINQIEKALSDKQSVTLDSEPKVVDVKPSIQESTASETAPIEKTGNLEPKTKSLMDELSDEDRAAAEYIFFRESGSNLYAINPTSKACGLIQANPCYKLTKECKLSDATCQKNWAIKYMRNRYGSPANAKKFWDEQAQHVPVNGIYYLHWL